MSCSKKARKARSVVRCHVDVVEGQRGNCLIGLGSTAHFIRVQYTNQQRDREIESQEEERNTVSESRVHRYL